MERHLLVTVSEKCDNLFAVRFVGIFFALSESGFFRMTPPRFSSAHSTGTASTP